MSEKTKEIINELCKLILVQEQEIEKLRKRNKLCEEYIEIYEEFIKGRSEQ